MENQQRDQDKVKENQVVNSDRDENGTKYVGEDDHRRHIDSQTNSDLSVSFYGPTYDLQENENSTPQDVDGYFFLQETHVDDRKYMYEGELLTQDKHGKRTKNCYINNLLRRQIMNYHLDADNRNTIMHSAC